MTVLRGIGAPWMLVWLLVLIGLHIQRPTEAVAQSGAPILPLDSLALRDSVPANPDASTLLTRSQQLGVRSNSTGATSSPLSRNYTNSMYGSRTAYVIGGAVVGALVTVAALIVYFANASSDAVAPPFALLPAVIGGAAIGALLGVLISSDY